MQQHAGADQCRDARDTAQQHGDPLLQSVGYAQRIQQPDRGKQTDQMAEEHGYLDLSEQMRSIIRKKAHTYLHPSDANIAALRASIEADIKQNNTKLKKEEILRELKALLEKHQAGRTPSLYPYSLENPVQIDKTLADEPNKDDEVAWWPN